MPGELFDHNAERQILGSAMVNNVALTQFLTEMRPEHFHLPLHFHVADAIRSLVDNGVTVDQLTVIDQLKKSHRLETCGGAIVVSNLTTSLVSTVQVRDHMRIVKNNHALRQLKTLGEYTANSASSPSTDPQELIDTLQERFSSISNDNAKSKAISANDALPTLLQEIEMRLERKGLVGCPSGYSEVDQITGGWRSGRLYVLAGRPGMGKTTFVLNACWRAAAIYNKRVLFLSLEMTKEELIVKCMSMVTGITSHQIDTGYLTPGDVARIKRFGTRSAPAQFMIDDGGMLSPMELRAKIFDAKMNGGVDLVVIDYLQLMNGGKSFQDENQEVSYISKSLKAISKQMSVPIVVLSQLSRDVEKRGGACRPKPSDLRGSGSIEQDADMIGFIYRPSVYRLKDDNGEPIPDTVAELIIAKHRGGGLHDVALKCFLSASRFYGRAANGGDGYEHEEIYTGPKQLQDEAF